MARAKVRLRAWRAHDSATTRVAEAEEEVQRPTAWSASVLRLVLRWRHGSTHSLLALVAATVQRGRTTLVIREVPALICGSCGERHLFDAVTQVVLALVEEVAGKGVEVEIREYVEA